MAKETFVIIGGGHAGGKAAQTLREQGFDGRIVVAGTEKHRPYMRPLLSKDFLRGDSPIDEAYLKPADYYAPADIELKPGVTAVKLSPRASEVTLSDGNRIHYHKLLIATGAQPVKLGLPGEDLAGVHYLRTIDDSEAIKREFRKGRHLVVIGSGWIACEVAASARAKGLKVTVILRHDVPFANILGPEIGQWYRELHEKHGVTFVKATVKRFRGEGTLAGVGLANRTVDCDLAVVAIGVAPDLELAKEAGLEIDGGLITDEYLETPAKDIFAAGDVANAMHPFYGERLLLGHWANAENQGQIVAKNMLGQRRPYDYLPFFFTDQYDTGMEYIGRATKWDKIVFRGDLAKADFSAFWMLRGRMVAALTMNGGIGTDLLEALIKGKRKIDRVALADPAIPLSTQL